MNAAGIFSATGGRKRMAAALMVALFAIAPAFAINFPALTGRVVDQANIIQPDTRVAIEQKLADLEDEVGDSARRCNRELIGRPGDRALRQ